MKVAVVGAGFTGTMTALALIKPNYQVTLIGQPPVALGVAYSTPFDYHLLNVPAGKMSALADDPDDFINWLEASGYTNPVDDEPLAQQFISRRIFGLYIKDKLEKMKDKLHIIEDEVTKLSPTDGGWQLSMANHPPKSFDKVILCTGNPPPDSQMIGSDCENVIHNPWNWQQITAIKPDQHVGILGTGLTMVDVVLSLSNQNHQGKITAISRHGYLPKAHDLKAKPVAINFQNQSPRAWFKQIKQSCGQQQDWRGVIDGMRPITQAVWQSFSHQQQSQFLRHLRAKWDVHRHRIAKQVAAQIDSCLQSQQLHVIAGSIKSLEQASGKLTLAYQHRKTGHLETIQPDVIINCMGPRADYRHIQSPLIQSLLKDGIVSPCTNRMGLQVDHDCQALNPQGQIQNLWVMGPPMKGVLWEIIAVPDLREQIKQVSEGFAGCS